MAGQGNSGVSAILVVSAIGGVAAVAVLVRFAVGGVIAALFGGDKTPDKTDTAHVLKNHTGGSSRRTPRKHRSRNGTRKA